MTHTDYTKKILNIKDENIYFYDNCLEIKKINGINTKIFHGYLTYTPEYCPHCGCINGGFHDIIKWNFKRNCKIKHIHFFFYVSPTIICKIYVASHAISNLHFCK